MARPLQSDQKTNGQLLLQDMSSEEKRSLQSSQKRVRDTISYHVAPGRITTHNLRGRQAVTSHTDKALKLRLDVIQGVFFESNM